MFVVFLFLVLVVLFLFLVLGVLLFLVLFFLGNSVFVVVLFLVRVVLLGFISGFLKKGFKKAVINDRSVSKV